MSGRRVSLPGADELFRSTSPLLPGGQQPAPAASPQPEPEPVEPATPDPAHGAAPADSAQLADVPVHRAPRPARERRPSGRERHDEKITVYCSAEELIDLERARLTLRGEHGLAVDRGRIVREALAVVLGDLESKGENSVLVRRLRGR